MSKLVRPYQGIAVRDMTPLQFKHWADWFNAAAKALARRRGIRA